MLSREPLSYRSCFSEAHEVRVDCRPSEALQGQDLVCDAELSIPASDLSKVGFLELEIAGPTPLSAKFGLGGNVIYKDDAVRSVQLISVGPVGNGYGYGYNGYGFDDGFPDPTGYGYDSGYGYEGYGSGVLRFLYRIVIDTGLVDDGDYLSRFLLFPSDPEEDPLVSEPDHFSILPGELRLEKILVTLSEIEVNKKKTGAGSPWVTIVPAGNPVTVDLLAVADGEIEGLLGDALAEPGIYKIIRMQIDDVKLKFTGQPLVSAKPTPPNRLAIR